MVGTLENPTLDLNPALPETLDVITATRSGVATYTDADGVIREAASDTVRVDYTQGEELTPTKFQNIGYTDFSSVLWAKNNATVTLNQETAPDGTQTAAKYVGSGTGQDLYYNANFNGPFTYSFYVKYINAPYIRLRNDTVSTWFDLETGSVATQNHDDASIEDVGDGWFRISVTVSSSSSLNRAYIHPHAIDNTTVEQDGGSFYLWGPQLEEGTTASDFVANTTGSPKFIASATYGDRVPMILVEPSATNLFPYSEDFGVGGWAITSGTLTKNYTISPDGLQNGSKINFSTGGELVRTTNFTAGQIYTLSFYAKVESGSFDFTYGNIDYTLVAGTATTEWQRFEVTQTAPVATRYPKIDATDTGDLLIWGLQLEAGSVATSYIPTSGSTVTRAADDLVISGSDFTDFYNSSEGTVYTEAIGRGYFNGNTVFAFNSGNSSNDSIYQRSPSNNQVLVVIDSTNGGLQAQLVSSGSVVSTGTLVRRAASFKLNNFESSQDGVDVTPDTSGTIPTIDRLRVGASPTGLNHLNGHIKRLIYWPYHSDSL
jgi:hypothetical protein